MPPNDFFKNPFDVATLTKLEIFELYSREWLPVFLVTAIPRQSSAHDLKGQVTRRSGSRGCRINIIRALKRSRGGARSLFHHQHRQIQDV